MNTPNKQNVKAELFHDHFQNFKRYNIPKAQLIIADIPYNLGNNAYASNPAWYEGGDNQNGESELAGKKFFETDENFKPAEFMHFCSQMLKSEPKQQKKEPIEGEPTKREKSNSPCMIVFCAFDQQMYLIELAKRYGLNRYINLVFRKNFSAQVLKAIMKVVGNAEYGLIFYRDRLPKFNNNGKMIFNVMDWELDNKTEKLHPTQKPVPLLEKLIKIFTDEGDVVIDPVAGSGTTLLASLNTNRNSYGFEITRDMYRKANTLLQSHNIKTKEIKEFGFAKTEINKQGLSLFS